MNFSITLTLCLAVFLLNFNLIQCACPVEADPLNLAKCIQLDIASILYAIKNSNDLTPICLLADRYMECVKTYTRGCVGFYFGEGALTELQNIALYCCNGLNSSTDCVFNPNVQHTCIDAEAKVKMWDLSEKRIESLQIGDKVKTLDLKSGKLIDTDVIMIMDTSDIQALFVEIRTKSNRSIKVSSTHLVALSNGEFKYANQLKQNDLILKYDFSKMIYKIEEIERIQYKKVKGFAAPLTLEGTILVDDILVSCYALIQSHTLAHLIMQPIRLVYQLNILFQDYLPLEYFLNFFRINKQANGVHWYPQLWHSFVYKSNLIKFLV